MAEQPQSFHDFGFLGQGTSPHGTRATYRAGCRCTPCRAANAAYEAARAALGGAGPVLVDAAATRARLLMLAKIGVGHHQAAKLAGVSFRTIQRIRTGKAERIRLEVAAAILGIERPALAKGVCVNGYETRHYVESLLREGFTKTRIAFGLGRRGKRLRLGRQVTARMALRMRALYQALTAE